MSAPEASLHTHTWRCRHAAGEVVDYARVARDAGLCVFGASDHTPLPDGRWAGVRMGCDQLAGYEAAVATARSEVPELRVLLGMECDIDAAYFGWYRDTFLARGYDYLIGAIHFVDDGATEASAFGSWRRPAAVRDWAARALTAIDSGLFAFLAHPDNLATPDAAWEPDVAAAAAEVCDAAAARGLPLELNSLGRRDHRGYPWQPFWELAATHGCTVVLSSDAHRPEDCAEGLTELSAYAASLGLRVIEPFTAGAPARAV